MKFTKPKTLSQLMENIKKVTKPRTHTASGDYINRGGFDKVNKVTTKPYIQKLDPGGVPYEGQGVGKKNAVQYPPTRKDASYDSIDSMNSLLDNQNGRSMFADPSARLKPKSLSELRKYSKLT